MKTVKNRVQIVGNIGSNPELKIVNNTKLVKLAVAVNEYKRYKSGHTSKRTQWHQIVVWGKLAENIQKYTSKGMQVLVDGKLKNRQYIDKSGRKVIVTEVIANEVVLNYSGQAA